MQEKIYRTDVRTNGDYDDIPAVAVFSIGEDTAKEIGKLASLVTLHGLHKVEQFDARAQFYRYDPEGNPEEAAAAGDENNTQTDCGCLNVSSTEFWFTAYLKHTTVEVLTERQGIAELVAHFGLPATATNNSAPQPGLHEIAQVVVFASGGVIDSVAIRPLPKVGLPCIVVDYDDRHDKAGSLLPEQFEVKLLGSSRKEFDKTATYIW